MVNDAKKHETEDKEKRQKIDLINQAEHLIFETEKNIKENSEKFSEKEKNDLSEKVESLKKVKDGGNKDDIKASMDALNATWSTLASKMYDSDKDKNNNSGPDVQDNNDKKNKKESEIEDADFEVVD